LGVQVNGHGANGKLRQTRRAPSIAQTRRASIAMTSTTLKHLDGAVDATPLADQSQSLSPGGWLHQVPTNEWDVQVTFDNYCWTACHQAAGTVNHRHESDTNPATGVVEFGTHQSSDAPLNTPPPYMFHDANVTWLGPFNGSPNFALCVSCHNPHGTDVVQPGENGSNHMLIYQYKMPSLLCRACHP
jgi:hypothetical protein